MAQQDQESPADRAVGCMAHAIMAGLVLAAGAWALWFLQAASIGFMFGGRSAMSLKLFFFAVGPLIAVLVLWFVMWRAGRRALRDRRDQPGSS